MSAIEVIYHGDATIELIGTQKKILCNDKKTQIIAVENHRVFYVYDRVYELSVGDKNAFDALFLFVDIHDSLDTLIAYIASIKTKYVVPMYVDTSLEMSHMLQDFARRVMLDDLGVPKVLKPGQMIVL